MKKHFIKLRSTPTRFLLSDVLPYELPASISNRGIYKFIEENKIRFEIKEGEIQVYIPKNDDKDFLEIITKLIFLSPGTDITKPYSFKIHVRNDKERTMSIIHPSSQISAMAFMERFKEQILYQCSISGFSIRKPYKIATVRYYYDYSHGLVSIGVNEKSSRIEEYGKEYETVRSFFIYREFSNIYKFYESRMHHNLEKKFRYMAQADISSCFDSIYTHSISWAVYGKEAAKSCRSNSNKDMCFPDMFDTLIRNSNYAETNGIPIGPELSRLFAEIILQRIDYNLQEKLAPHKIKYQICRYVDDYFIFYNNTDDYKKIKKHLIECLAEYNLKLNESKETINQKLPLISNISTAKYRITDFFEDLNNLCGWKEDENGIKHFRLPRYTAEEAIIKYKTISAEIDEALISNYLLTRFEIFIQSITDNWIKGCKKSIKENYNLSEIEINEILKSRKKMARFFQNVIMFSFFVLSSDMSVNSFIIVSRIIMLILKTVRISRNLKLNTKENQENLLLIPSSEVYREIVLKIQQYIESCNHENTSSVEKLMLINVAAELEGKLYLKKDTLLSIIKANKDDYMTIVVVMRYIRNLKKYNDIRSQLIDQAKEILNQKFSSISADQTMITFDMLACPYINNNEKLAILDLYTSLFTEKSQIKNLLDKKKKIIELIGACGISFTNWTESSLAYELEFKRAEFVY